MNPELPSDELSDVKRELLELLLLQEFEEDPDGERIPKRSTSNQIPLSFAQQRLWFIDQMEHGKVNYNIHQALAVKGTFPIDILQRTLDEITQRHEVLRTRFAIVDGMPAQIIAPCAPAPFRFLDISNLTESTRNQKIRELLYQDFSHVFDLEQGPVWRVSAVLVAEGHHILSLSTHHIISDGWSIGVLIKELASIFRAYSLNQPSPLEPLPIQYGDFSQWQRSWLTEDEQQKQVSYWRNQLDGAPPLLELPTDRPRPARQNFMGASERLEIDATTTNGLKALANAQQGTLFMVLYSALAVLLHRYSAQDDIVMGTPIANRNRKELEPLIGFFANSLVLRLELKSDPSFKKLLEHAKQTALDAYANQDIPFERVVETLKPERTTSYNPLFQVMFGLQNAPSGTMNLPNVVLEPVDTTDVPAQFDLTISGAEQKDRLHFNFSYRVDLFEQSTMGRLIRHFSKLLSEIATNAARPISRLPLLEAKERQYILESFNQMKGDYPQEMTFNQRFESQASIHASATALCFGPDDKNTLSYSALNRLANLLAHHLMSLGVGPETMVGLCLERSPEMIITLLAILKAGAAYVPLNPDYPQERLKVIIDDANLPLIVSNQTSAPSLPQLECLILLMDRDWPTISQGREDQPVVNSLKDNLAYVIFTSGSTGRPKGVLLSHGGLCNLSCEQGRRFEVSPKSRILQFASLSFDASIWEISMALGNGACLYLARANHLLPGPEMATMLRTVSITHVTLPPSTLAHLPHEHLPALTTIVVAGEACPPSLVARWSAGRHFWNAYGPTETTVCATMTLCESDGLKPCIGKPLANIEVFILDKNGAPSPIGIPGELFIGGPGLARGYLHQAQRTASAFVPHPFSTLPGARLYASGDRARILTSGQVDFLGRFDHQVKLRGFRIELDEIRSVLSIFPGVREAAVLVREDKPGHQVLVAYAVIDEGQRQLDALREYLRGQLPNYMVPAVIIFLDTLPQTSNGKLDRKALPAALANELGYQEPHTETQRKLAAIWSQLLGIDQIGTTDNFFDCGGHSLTATRVMARVQEVFDLRLEVRYIFDHPTLELLAAQIDIALAQGFRGLPPLESRPPDANPPLSFSQQRLWFFEQLQGPSHAYNIPTPLRLDGFLDVQALQRSANIITSRHETLRTHFGAEGGKPFQIISSPAPVPLPLVDLCTLPEHQREAMARQLSAKEAARPFNLGQGPLLRIFLLRLSDRCHIMLVTMHHIISDGWSVGLLIRELTDSYRAYSQDLEPTLPELPFQFGDFAHWQHRHLSGDILDAQIRYWQEKLKSTPETISLPADRARPMVKDFTGAITSFHFDPLTSQAIRNYCLTHNATLFMVMQAAFSTLLARYSGQTDIVTGTSVANRGQREVEALIGFFVNSLALRVDLSGNPHFGDALARTRASALEAFANQDVPFEQVVEAVKPTRDMSISPIFQVMFLVQNLPMEKLSLPALELGMVQVEQAIARFDMTVMVMDAPMGISGTLEYSKALYDEASAKQLVNHYTNLVRAILTNDGARLSDIPLMDAAERTRLCETWNATATLYDPTSVVDLISQQAARTPETYAVRLDETDGQLLLTYAQLEQSANTLALQLLAFGLKREQPVAVIMERHPSTIIAMLAVWKAAGTLLPLDSTTPAPRLAYILEDSGVSLAITPERNTTVADYFAGTLLYLSSTGELRGEARSQRLPQPILDDQLAYVIYTSGSTGQPKGSQVPMGAFRNLLHWYNRFFEIGANSHVVEALSIGFDASVKNIFAPLICGGQTVLFRNGPFDAKDLLATLKTGQVHLLNCVCSMAYPIVEFAAVNGFEDLTSLRYAALGGEEMDLGKLRPWLEHANCGCTLVNIYGPTECTDTTLAYKTTSNAMVSWRVPIGTPIDNTRVYIVDGYLNLQPLGVAGELLVGGIGPARGYLRRPSLTAEKYIPDPFAAKPGSRLYRTGDLVSWLRGSSQNTGLVSFLGRLDAQVKLRGYRIELGEVEAAIGDHPLISAAAALLHKEPSGRQFLLAYVVEESLPDSELAPETGDTCGQVLGRLTQADLKKFIKERLPEYMVPAVVITLNCLPRLASGKIDRKTLAKRPLSPDLFAGEDFEPARNRTEEELCQIWARVLGVERVGIHNNFFDLGGHSLIATQMVSRVRDAFGVDLPLKELFAAPTVAQLSPLIQQLGDEASQLPPMLRVSRSEQIPLSFAQQRLWFLDQLEPGEAHYNIPNAVVLHGKLHVLAMERTINEILQRHESLRTRFQTVANKPVQVVADKVTLSLDVRDLSGFGTKAHDVAGHIIRREARRPFQLDIGPMLRAGLLRLANEDHILYLNMHHISADGWSVSVLNREIVALFVAFSEDRPSPLPPLPIQYPDYAVWQRSWLQGEVLDAQIRFWKDTLSGHSLVLELPTDKPRPAVETYRGSTVDVLLPSEMLDKLHALARHEQGTLFMVLLAAFKVLLMHYTKQYDLLIGTPIANRRRSDTENIIGFFANTLVMRTDLSGDPQFNELVQRVKASSLQAYAHQDIPFENLVEAVQPKRDMSRSPIFQVMFVLQNAQQQRSGAMGTSKLRFKPVDMHADIAKFDLTLFTLERGDGLRCTFEYNTDLFEVSSAANMAAQFLHLLEEVGLDARRQLSQLPVVSETERHKLLVTWNDTQVDYHLQRPFHLLVEATAQQTPEVVSVAHGDETHTYAILNGEANRLAHHLRELGVGPESVVGIMLDRSFQMVTSFLAVIKAGGAVVALDPAYPPARLSFIIQDAKLNVLLTQGKFAHVTPKGATHVLLIDSQQDLFRDKSRKNPPNQTSLQNLLYVIYTSGSTGNPKGVGVSHAALRNLLHWQGCETLRGRNRTLQFAAFGFCVSFQEILSTWCAGGTLILAGEEERKDAEQLLTYLDTMRVERLHLPFAALKQLAMTSLANDFAPQSLCDVITAGEQLQVTDAIRTFFSRIPGCRLHNQYGSSETHVISALTLDGDPALWPVLPSAGKSIANTSIYLLDAYLQTVPIGTPGELYASGVCLGRNYLNLVALTAQKMVPDPFGEVPGSRLYRTGDLARFRTNGTIQFLGRADDMVKIRGYRVEPGELETELRAYPEVVDVAVIALLDDTKSYYLAAYLVLSPNVSMNVREIRQFLEARVPSFMIPTAFMRMEVLPITSHGKLDRDALPKPEANRDAAAAEYAPPTTATEQILAGLWSELLKVERIGAHDSFFELGGHSLLATQVISQIRETFQIELALRALFEDPTLSGLAARVELALRTGNQQQLPPIEAVLRPDGRAPLSFAQQRLWFLDQLSGGKANYSMPAAVRLEGRLNNRVLARCLDEIVRRHESLRTTFGAEDGKPFQHIAGSADCQICEINLQQLEDPQSRELALRQKVNAELSQPFDLSQGPLLRVTLLEMAETDHVLLVNMHHIISDGWSIGILINELVALYTAFLQDSPSPLPEPRLQYADFAHWQRGWLQGEALERQLSYWCEALSDAPKLLELPYDRPRPANMTFSGAVRPFSWPTTINEGVRALNRSASATSFMTFTSVFAVMMARFSGSRDLVIGTPIANRNHKGVENLIGFFVNTLPMRFKFDHNPSFADLLRQVRETAMNAYAHQDLPFEQLVEALGLERDMGHTPLFQVMFALQNAPMSQLELPGLTLKQMSGDHVTSRFDLTFSVVEGKRSTGGSIEYNTDLFDRETINQLSTCFLQLLQSAIEDPQRSIFQLPMLSTSEQQQILLDLNVAPTAYPDHRSIGDLFEETAAADGSAIALEVAGDPHAALDYDELNRNANRLARYLITRGVTLETPVAVFCDRGLSTISAFLAILKAGGTYVPIDPAYPSERVAFMLQDSSVNLVLTQQHLNGHLPTLNPQLTQICLDDSGTITEITKQSATNLNLNSSANQLAYVMYTSGSTSKPNGVWVTHRGVIRLVCGNSFMKTPQRMLHMAPVSFDAATLEIWGPLLNGSTCLLFPEKQATVAAIGKALAKGRVDSLWLTASLFNLIMDEAPEVLANVGQLLVGGEALSTSHVRQALEHFPRTRLINGYGPTENTTFTTCYSIPQDHSRHAVPIGRAIANTSVHVLDPWGQPVPVGVPGELYTGGAGLARGYLKRPALTAARFVPNPFGAGAGARLYRSGDLVRYLHDGNLDFLGRIDQQIKVRGFRIEPGEIEATLNEHPLVRASVVTAMGNGTQRHLAAHLKTDPQWVGTATELTNTLRAFLGQSLADYMIPTIFIQVEEFPLTPSGKVDRRALCSQAVEVQRDQLEAYLAPRDSDEEKLAAIFAEILEVERVGVHQSFFDLGGHSLLATQIISRILKVFGAELALRHLFEAPTVAALVPRIQLARNNTTPKAPAIVPVDRSAFSKGIPLSFAQQRLWFLDRLAEGSPFYNIPLAVRLRGSLNVNALSQALDTILRRHEILRTRFDVVEGEPVQLVETAHPGRMGITVLRHLEGAERETQVRHLASQHAAAVFKLDEGNLFRAQLLVLSDNHHVLLLNMHHIVSDGWSMGVFIREIGICYRAFNEGKPDPLPPLTLQYADFAVWQRTWLSAVLAQQLNFWKDQLQGAPPTLDLACDHPRPAVQSFQGASTHFDVDVTSTLRMKALAREEGATLFMTSLAAFKVLLARYSGLCDIVVGTPIANRHHGETEPLIGFFVNNLVLRTRLDDQPSFRDLVARVRDTTLACFANQDLPFEKLVEELKPPRDTSRSPLFQVMFTFESASKQQEPSAFAGLELSRIEGGGEAAKYDLQLSLAERNEGLGATFTYNIALFEATNIERMANHFAALLSDLCANPERSIGEAFALSACEQDLPSRWNPNETDFPDHLCLHECFEQQVAIHGDKIAVSSGNDTLTYNQLNARAEHIALRLRARGVLADQAVGLCLHRGPELMVGLLAILKSGGAFLPLEPKLPSQRLKHMLADAGARWLLTQRSLAEQLSTVDVEAIYLDEILPSGEAHSQSEKSPTVQEHKLARVTPENLAYIIYTSGSSGQPKGVMISHRAALNYVTWASQTYGMQVGVAVPVHGSIGFDATLTSLLLPLMNGAYVVMVAEEIDGLAQVLENRGGFAFLKLTPAHLELLPQRLSSHKAATQTAVLVLGGEALFGESLNFWNRHAPQTRTFNEYGPTETVVGCAVYEVPNHFSGAVPIGKAIANTSLHVVDRFGRIAPLGVRGELVIGGCGLGRGYLARPGQTAAAFIPDAFSLVAGERLYRSGDRVRHLPNGDIVFLGRIDQQVKLRGYRVEPGEIENNLIHQPGVGAAAVLPQRTQTGDTRLVAYVQASDAQRDQDDFAQQLRQDLRQQLPEYMVPAAFVILQELPITASGKVDRRALSQLDVAQHQATGQGYLAPRTELETGLVRIWQEMLAVPRVGIHDNFFDLGGHSLLATRITSRIRQDFDLEVPLSDLFEAPTVAGLASRIGSTKVMSSLPKPPPIVAVEPGAHQHTPLSFAQQRLWFIDQLAPGNTFYNMPAAVILSGPLDITAMAAAFEHLLARHAVLRTRFAIVEYQPVQLVDDFRAGVLEINQAQDQPQDEASLYELARQHATQSFQLATGPLFRATLHCLGNSRFLLLVNMHHIVSDGWSMMIFMREMSAFYRAAKNNRSISLPPLAVQYSDFSVWQRTWLQGEVLEAHLAYWQHQLAGAPAYLDLATDFQRPAQQSFNGADLAFDVPRPVAAALRRLNRNEGCTLFMTFLAMYKVLLWRYSGQEDIVVGSPVANRNYAELELLMGFFVNELALRTRLDENASFRQLMAAVRTTTLGAYAHQDLPFEKLVEALKPERDMSRAPIYQVSFAAESTPAGKVDRPFDDLKMERLEAGGSIAKFDLALTIADNGEHMAGQLNYNQDLFKGTTIEIMARHLVLLAEQIVDQPDLPLKHISLLTIGEKQQLAQWHELSAPYLPAQPPQQLIAQQAAHHPNRIALEIEGGSTWTYKQLRDQVTALATILRKSRIGLETPVALYLPVGPEYVIALLAVLEVGAYFVPLSPKLPAERIAYQVADARVALVLSNDALRADLAPLTIPLLMVTANEPSGINAQSEPYPQQLAYVIYTSGSTGKPKGVAIANLAMAQHIQNISVTYQLSHQDRVLQFSAPHFDMIVEELLPTLSSGACLVIPTEDTRGDFARLNGLVNQAALSVLNLPATYWHEWVNFLETSDHRPQRLRLMVVGTERVSPEVMTRWLAMKAANRTINAYGPTEATVTATTFDVDLPLWSENSNGMPIGTPLAGISAHILDRHLRPVSPGRPGHLVLAGPGLARGYLHNPAQTAVAFLPNPFGASGDRLYASGDRARFLNDNSGAIRAIEFLGRIDFQVKIRGFRIEPGEIENALQSLGSVAAAVVVDRPTAGGTQLVAYVTAQNDYQLESNHLRTALEAQLPIYMVPSAIRVLDRMPQSSTGKIDRGALKRRAREEEPTSSAETSYTPPRTAVETALANSFAELLLLDQVGIYDDFFALGGHSLLATQLISRLRTLFQIEVPLRKFFEMPTVAGLAGAVEAAQTAGGNLAAPPIIAVPRQGHLPTSFAQQRLWFIDRLQPGSPAYNMPMAMRITGTLDQDALQLALDALVARHETLRTSFVAVDDEPLQHIAPVAPLPLIRKDISMLEEVARKQATIALAEDDATTPFDLELGPLFRVSLIREANDSHVLLLNIHHIISDGWSMGLLTRELGTLYKAFSTGQPSPLKPLSLQYADYAHWQRQWVSGEILQSQLAYWRKQLAEITALELPTDWVRPTQMTYIGATQNFVLAPEIGQKLQALARREGATLFMVLCSAFQALLARYTGSQDITVGTPIANRNHSETEAIIGFFVNTLVMRARLDAHTRFCDLLASVRSAALDAYAHQDLPFEKLVAELQPERDPSRSPLFQVMLVLQNVADETIDFPGLKISAVNPSKDAAKFDLTLSMVESKNGISGGLNYNVDLFEAATITRMIEHFKVLVAAIVRRPEERLADLDLVSQKERHLLLSVWSQGPGSNPGQGNLARLVEAHAARTPTATALIVVDVEGEAQVALTYADLNSAANRLATYLTKLGVGMDTAVALAGSRSTRTLVGMLAILKAGGCYVPLDPSLPVPRQRFILENSEVKLILTEAAMASQLPQDLAALVVMDPAPASKRYRNLMALPDHNLDLPVHPDQLAYIMYTSGSTGNPKGVCIPQRAVMRLVHDQWFFLLPQRTLQLAPLSFDASTFEIWSVLLHGRTCCLLEESLPSAQLLGKALRAAEVDTLWLTASLFNLMVDESAEIFHPLRQLLVGGEALSVSHVRRLQRACPKVTIINGYGPTENTTFTCCYPIVDTLTGLESGIPIGGPLAHSSVYVLDARMSLCPIGLTGELFTGGDGLGRDYLKQPSLTARSFVPNPFSQKPGARLYRTGDRVRRRERPDGTSVIEFLGRMDNQLKLRGFRIEPGEVEAIMIKHREISQAVVTVTRSARGGQLLVAYLTLLEGMTSESPQTAHFRRYLEGILPAHMVPDAFIVLKQLPLTANGKLDRKALPLPDITHLTGAARSMGPRDDLEMRLISIWQEVLGLSPIGVRDNFFELGGHSLMAVRLMSRIKTELERDLPLSILFQSPTIEGLAAELRREEAEVNSPIIPVQTKGSASPLYLVHAVGGNVFSYAALSQNLGNNQPVYGLQSPTLYGDMRHTTVESMASHYIAAMKAIQPEGPYQLGGWSVGGLIAYEMAVQLRRAGEQVPTLVLIDSYAAMDIDKSQIAHILEKEMLQSFFINVGGLYGLDVTKLLKELDKDRLPSLDSAFKKSVAMGILPIEFEQAHFHKLWLTFKTNFAAMLYYRPQPYDGDMTYLKATERPDIAEEERAAGLKTFLRTMLRTEDRKIPDPVKRWQKLAQAAFSVIETPGDHHSSMREPHVSTLAHRLGEVLLK